MSDTIPGKALGPLAQFLLSISRLEIVYQVVSYLAAIIAGYFSNNLDKTWGSIGFVVIVIMGATAILLTLQERRKGRW